MATMNAFTAPSMSPLAPPAAMAPLPYYPAVPFLAPPPVAGVQLIPVTAANYEAELDNVAALLPRYPHIAIDTEYPGVVHHLPPPWKSSCHLTPPERYALVKANVDAVPVVQLGITLSDELGNIPVAIDEHGQRFEVAWEVTFSDFDPRRHAHSPDSAAFLRSRGLDFEEAQARGVASAAFAAKLAEVLAAAAPRAWAAFGGAHDFGYLVKMLAGGQPLPGTWHEFAAVARDLLGGRVFDGKYMAEHCEREDLCGGLRRVAATLRVERRGLPEMRETTACLAGGKSHMACCVYTAMRRQVMYRDGGASREGQIDGLHY